MAKLLLAGDIGGTKTSLGIYEPRHTGRPRLLREATIASRDYHQFDAVLDAFLAGDVTLAAAAFGIAGPVDGDVVQLTNLPWRIEATELADRLGCPVRLLNDLEATAFATLDLRADEVQVLNPGVDAPGNRCVLAAGTGLGQALLPWDGAAYRPFASEGGHADFAPRNETELQLLRFLLQRNPRVSSETVLSGAGLVRIFDFVVAGLGVQPAAAVTARFEPRTASQVIGAAALAAECPACERAVDLFVSIYGAQAGNLALTSVAVGGVYVAGGIVLKLLPKFMTGEFVAAFVAKQPFESLLRRIPVRVMLAAEAPRTGAAAAAAALVVDGVAEREG